MKVENSAMMTEMEGVHSAQNSGAACKLLLYGYLNNSSSWREKTGQCYRRYLYTLALAPCVN